MSETIYDPIADALNLDPITFDVPKAEPIDSLSSLFIGKQNPAYGYKWSKEQRENISKRRKELGTFAGKNNPMYGKTNKGMLGMTHTEEAKKRMSESAKRRGSNRTGAKHDAQARANISKALIQREPLKCPHCDMVSKSASNMKRYHFDNCKNKS